MTERKETPSERDDRMYADAHIAKKDLSYLIDAEGYTLAEANRILQYREDISFKHPEEMYEKVARKIYEFIETVHPELGYEVQYSEDVWVDEKIDEDPRSFCLIYGSALNIIDIIKEYPLSEEFKDLEKHPLDPKNIYDWRNKVYEAIFLLSEFNPVFRENIAKIDVIWKVQDILLKLQDD